MRLLASLASGVLFGAGLAVSHMIEPRKILDFLDVAAIARGGWDPTLLMVFLGALPVMFLAYQVQRRMRAPLLDAGFALPSRRDIDTPLIVGSALFGIGWGLVGVCPGPAVAMLGAPQAALGHAAVLLLALMAGVALAMVWRRATSDG